MKVPVKAICILEGKYVHGEAFFTENLERDITTIKISMTGLTPGKHGIHIHAYGDRRKGCDSMGSHYNPFNKEHGAPKDKYRHVGDLGNIIADKDGNAKLTIKDPLVKLHGKYSVVGRGLVVHADEDDLGRGGYEDSKTTGHAGKRVACGIIALME